MGECHCSKIAIMQLFHELKQQFPALPDYVVSQCIAQNSHDREICARSLQATQESRPPPGAFPPPPPQSEPLRSLPMNLPASDSTSPANSKAMAQRAQRPLSLDIGGTRRSTSVVSEQSREEGATGPSLPSSAPAACAPRGFFEDVGDAGLQNRSSFELSVNVDCGLSGDDDYENLNPSCEGASSLQYQQQQQEQQEQQEEQQQDYQPALLLAEPSSMRSFTSVSLTLRPPSSEPQPPIDVSSQGSSLTYSSSSLNSWGFQSLLQINIGHGAGATAARIKPPPAPQRPGSLLGLASNRPPGLPAGPPSQLPRPTMSAPTTPSTPARGIATPPSSLPATPLVERSTNLGTIPRVPKATTSNDPQNKSDESDQSEEELPKEFLDILKLVEDEYRPIVKEQLIRKERLAKALEVEEGKLEDIKKDIESLSQSSKTKKTPQEIERQLRSEIYMLQLECDKLAAEVDRQSGLQVPLGETNEAFYQSIYTGQQYVPPSSNDAPTTVPNQPSTWESPPSTIDTQDEADGPSWVCQRCTFKNHPLMNKCEQCDMPRPDEEGTQGTRITNTNEEFATNVQRFPSTSR